MTVAQSLLIICLASPFVAAIAIVVCRKRRVLCDVINLATPFVSLLAGVVLLVWLPEYRNTALTLLPLIGEVPIAFGLEPLGIIFAGLICLLWPVAALYTSTYMFRNQSGDVPRFLAYYNLAIGSALAIAFASNFLTLFVFYEVLTLSTYPLITHSKSEESKTAGRFYLATLLGTSTIFLLIALIWIWQLSGSLDFVPGGILRGAVEPFLAGWLLLLVVAGSAKAAIMPLHGWLPQAMVAPVPVSALLHAVAVVKAGVFTIVKVMVYIFGLDFLAEVGTQWLVYLAGITIVMASLIALYQKSIKKMLAYSTVSQLSYIVIGAALLKPAAIVGVALHMLAHGFGKITLFFAAGAIQTVSGKTQVDEVSGLGKTMPWTMGAFAVAALSIIGLPPLAGFSGKWFILSGATFARDYFVIAVIAVSTILNTMYFVPVIYRAFFGRCDSELRGEAPCAMLIAIIWPVLVCLLLFFYVDVITDFIAGILR